MKRNAVLFHLSLIDGIGSQTIHKINQAKPANLSWNDLYSFSMYDLVALGISGGVAQKIFNGLKNKEILKKEEALLEKHAISLISRYDDDYPNLLRHISVPPAVLYIKGHINPHDQHIAFVGSRQANHYGKRVIDSLIPALVAHKITIVSGGAYGADSMAHHAAIEAGGKTIVILGSGLLELYPAKNKKLFEQAVATGGAVVSPFPLHTNPLPGNFAARNRIIAGLSRGVVVVQAAQRSGTRITAQFALEQGRDVFAVPGLMDDPLSAGCHALIQQGAKLITSADDILEEYGIHTELSAQKEVKNNNQRSEITNNKEAPTTVEESILALCRHAQTIDEIASKTEKNLRELQVILFEMQIAGVIEQNFAGLWKVR